MQRSPMPPLTWLRAFEASARHLSFTAASRELNLTQSAVSQHVRSLEALLGRELFIRKTRAIELTEDGANYLPVIRDAFELIAGGTQAFVGDRERHLIVQCNMAFSVFWLAPRLHRLYQRHPWIVLNIITPIWDPERNAAQASLEIRFGRAQEMSKGAERLNEDRYYPVCRPDYHEGDVDLKTAALFDCAGVAATWETWFKSQGQVFERLDDVNRGSTYVIALSAALNGAGITMAHDTLVSNLIARGDLVKPFAHAPRLQEGYYLLPPPQHAQTSSASAFVSWLSDEVSAQRTPVQETF